MEMPQPNAEHKKLERIAGVWKGTETMYPSEWNPEGCTADGVTTSRVALNGFGVVMDYEQSVDGNPTFNGHGIYSVDTKTNEVLLHWFDSMGSGCEEFRGSWEGNKLTLHSPGGMMGQMRMTYEFGADNKLSSMMESSQDGKTWTKLFDAAYTMSS